MRLFIGICLLVILTISEGKAENLEIQANGQKISLAYWPAQTKKQYGGILIVKEEPFGEGFTISTNLAKRFAKLGWSVAILDAQQKDRMAWIGQLPDALSNLRQKTNKRIVLLYYGSQLQVLLGYFSKLQAKQVNGLILLSAFSEPMAKDEPELLKKIAFPVLDIMGQFDYTPVLNQIAARRKTNQNPQYRVIQLPGATHDYLYNRRMLVAYLHGWMKHLRRTERAKPPVTLMNGFPTRHS
ncbi:DUF3530 family protein [Legionella drozanskii]|uniref:ATPases involved in biogenesis of archaeal flagella n=1 Tax=Legionella drozanskii LLAP-1 TaxID=1212489 RepID=A0A0W0SRK8_9GAMM|nr:DUF3530 family protein [Legionella drozanskii]KTC85923.1 ATPases involved in biogenesis of archaeal flagella [Legionella drozanskii LLAP-1]